MPELLVPRVLEDNSWNDFAGGSSYECRVVPYPDERQIRVSNTLLNMEWLEDRVESGDVAWSAELRIPRALFSATRIGTKNEDIVLEYEGEEHPHNAYAVSRLCVRKKIRIPKEHLSTAWRKLSGAEHIPVLPGSILAQSSMHAINFSKDNIFAFKTDNAGEHLNKEQGRMKASDSGKPNPLFHVIVSDDVHATLTQDRNLWVQALQSVLSILAREEGSWDDPRYEPVRSTLESLGLDTSWNDSDFHPDFWASKWEAITPVRNYEEDAI